MKISLLLLISLALAQAILPKFSHKSRRMPAMSLVSSSIQDMEVLAKLEVPSNTENEYSQLILPNGIKCTIVSIPASEKAAAALSIKVGAQDDSLAGMAHFTEHAVFLGSDKYPEENKFKTFLSQNGGSSNGGTAMDMTTFQFEVNKNAFEDTLDIWSQFFVKPLFRDDAIAREIMAVTAEDSKNRILDGRRMLQVMKDLIIKGQRYSKFSTGNVHTLALSDADKHASELARLMKNFHAQHYRPETMSLALCGPQSVDELKRLALMFADISVPVPVSINVAVDVGVGVDGSAVDGKEKETELTNELLPAISQERQLEEKEFQEFQEKEGEEGDKGFPFVKEALGGLVRLRPVKDVRDMAIMFGMPPTRAEYRKNPTDLISFLLSHKGPGSLFSALQSKGWASGVSAGTRTDTDDFSIFQVSVALTPDGFDHWEEVLKMVYSRIAFLETCTMSDLRRVWNELRSCNILDFSYQEKSTAYGLAPFLCRQMAHYPLEHILSEGWLLDEMDEKELLRVVDISKTYLRPARSVTFLRNQPMYREWIPEDNINITNPYSPVCEELAAELMQQDDKDKKDKDKNPSLMSPITPNRVEMWYGVPYHLDSLAPSLLQELNDIASGEGGGSAVEHMEHKFPEPNRYVSFDSIEAYSSSRSSSRSSTVNESRNVKEGGEGKGVEEEEEGEAGRGDILVLDRGKGKKRLRSTPPVKLVGMVEKVPSDVLDSLALGLHPNANANVDVDTVDVVDAVSVSRQQLWHSKDEAFGQPRTQINVFLRSTAGSDAHPINNLISSVFHQSVASQLFPAAVAGLSYSTSCGVRGVGFSVSGYSQKLPQLLEDIVKDFSSAKYWKNVDPKLYELCKERTIRALRSWDMERPDSQCETLLSYLLTESTRYLPWERLVLAEQISPELLQKRAKEFFSLGSGVTTYSHGDTNEDVAREIHENLVSMLAISEIDVDVDVDGGLGLGLGLGLAISEGEEGSLGEGGDEKEKVKEKVWEEEGEGGSRSRSINSYNSNNNRSNDKRAGGCFLSMEKLVQLQQEMGTGIIDLKQRARLLQRGHLNTRFPSFNEGGENSALLVHFQSARMHPKVSATMLYLRRYLSEPMFDTLRTKKQLGYIVSLSNGGYGRAGRHMKTMRGFTARILSNRFSPDEMLTELELFLDSQAERIQGLEQEDVTRLAEVLVNSLLDPPTTYREEADDFWGCLLDERGFDWTDKIVHELRQLTADDVRSAFMAWFKDQVSPPNPNPNPNPSEGEGEGEEGREVGGDVDANPNPNPNPIPLQPSHDKHDLLYRGEGRRSVAVMMYGKDHMGEDRPEGARTASVGRSEATQTLTAIRDGLSPFDPFDP